MAEDSPYGVALIGRAAEWLSLREQLVAAQSGHGGVALIGGEPGAGKTRLAEELTHLASAFGMGTAWGFCQPDGQMPVLFPWNQVCQELGAGRLGTSLLGLGDAFVAFEEFVADMSELVKRRPAVIVIDDLQWADTVTLRLLEFFGFQVGRLPCLVVCTARDEPFQGSQLRQSIANLTRRRTTRRYELSPLPEQDAIALATAVAGHSLGNQMEGAIAHLTGGNAFFAVEVGRTLATNPALSSLPRVPESVKDLVRLRVAALPERTELAIQAAAVAGREFDVPALAAAIDAEPAEVIPMIEALTAARLVHPIEGHRFRFAHALAQEAIYEDVAAIPRAQAHARLADFFADHGTIAGNALAAYHAVRGLPVADASRAVALATQAGEAAFRQGDPASAADHFKGALLALDLTSPTPTVRAGLLVKLARAQVRAGNVQGGKETALEAIELARPTGDNVLFAEAVISYSAFAEVAPRDDRRTALTREALSLLPEEAKVLRAQLGAFLAESLIHQREMAAADEASATALAEGRASNDSHALGTALNARLWYLQDSPDLDSRRQMADEQVALGTSTGDHTALMTGLRWRLLFALEAGDGLAVRAAIAAHERESQVLRMPLMLWRSASHRVLAAILRGDLVAARDRLNDSLETSRLMFSRGMDTYFAVHFFIQRRFRGELGRMIPSFERAAADPNTRASVRALLGGCYLECGQPDLAIEQLRQSVAAHPRGLVHDLELSPVVTLGEIAARSGDLQMIECLTTELAPYALHFAAYPGGLGPIGPVARVLGLLADARADRAEAVRLFEIALGVCDGLDAPLFRAECLADYGEALVRRGQPAERRDGQAMLAEALQIAGHRGMRALHTRLEAFIRGSSAGAASSMRPAGLTAREVEILELVAGGTTNQQTAEELVLSPRTVERHIANLYRKIGARNRADATTFALRNGLTPRLPTDSAG